MREEGMRVMVDLEQLAAELRVAGWDSFPRGEMAYFERQRGAGRCTEIIAHADWRVELAEFASGNFANCTVDRRVVDALDIIRRHISPPDQADGEVRERIRRAVVDGEKIGRGSSYQDWLSGEQIDAITEDVLAAIGGAVNPAPAEAG